MADARGAREAEGPISARVHARGAREDVEYKGSYDEVARRKRRRVEEPVEDGQSERRKFQKIHVARAGEKVMERIRRRVKRPG